MSALAWIIEAELTDRSNLVTLRDAEDSIICLDTPTDAIEFVQSDEVAELIFNPLVKALTFRRVTHEQAAQIEADMHAMDMPVNGGPFPMSCDAKGAQDV